ncbi:MAG: MMPL family transporter, partial [Fimbriimonas ginsengisoli]|nr:MMPL family transporter [Fimbriimonas ginsengisoli]
GMAVDANILVFERFKEEMRSGKALKSAMELGFRRAIPAIIDSNACTIITSIVLMELGTGPVKGFATTLVIGVAISLFTAVFVTRSLLMFLVGSGFANDHKWYAVNHEWFGKRFQPGAEPLTVVEKSKRWFLLSGITILIGVPFAFIGGFKLNVEFRGGAEASFTHVDATMTREQIATNLDRAGFKGANIKFSSEPGGQRLVSLTLPQSPQFLEADGKPRSDEKVLDDIAVAAGVARHHQDPTGKDFTDKDTFGSVGPVIRGETISNAIWGVILSSSLIIIYLAFRFGFAVGGFVPGLKFGVSAIGALIHDILVVIFLAAVVGYFEHWEISALFITAMLTIIGFSVHDTIVIFDRIRENLRRPNKGEA